MVINERAIEGPDISELNRNIAQYKLENALLYAQILEETSYQTIHRKAKELGFIEPTHENYIILK